MTVTRIAELAQVSKAAVSLVLNGKAGVGAETRARILRVATEIGYVPRPRAQPNLKSIRILAVADGDILDRQFSDNPFLVELVNGIQHASQLAGYACVVSVVPPEDISGEWARAETALRSDGVLILGTNIDAHQLGPLCAEHPAVVVVDTFDARVPANMVAMNSGQGAALVAEHFLALGHTSIGLGRCHTRIVNFQAREESFTRTLAAKGIHVHEQMVFGLPSSIDGAQREFSQMLEKRRSTLPTAIFCENDYMAIGVVKALKTAGVSIPGEVSVAGFDDIRETLIITPELTTVRAPREKIAQLAMDRLLDILKGETGPCVKQLVDVKLIARGSTGAPRR